MLLTVARGRVSGHYPRKASRRQSSLQRPQRCNGSTPVSLFDFPEATQALETNPCVPAGSLTGYASLNGDRYSSPPCVLPRPWEYARSLPTQDQLNFLAHPKRGRRFIHTCQNHRSVPWCMRRLNYQATNAQHAQDVDGDARAAATNVTELDFAATGSRGSRSKVTARFLWLQRVAPLPRPEWAGVL